MASPLSIPGFEPFARVTQYLTDYNALGDLFSVANHFIADSYCNIKIAPNLRSAKEQGVTLTSDPRSHREKKGPNTYIRKIFIFVFFFGWLLSGGPSVSSRTFGRGAS